MNTRRWLIQKTDKEKCAVLQRELDLLPVTAKLLYNRELDTPEKARAFLCKESFILHDPFLLKDMDKAVERINYAITNHQRVCIYGDYDVDGVTATTLLYTYLIEKGVNCHYFIPERITEGYGLNTSFISRMQGEVDLVITVDTGITAIEEVDLAKQLGIDMIITDHHSCRTTLPNAVAVVNPHREDSDYPFKQLAGVGVVFKLLCALDGDTQYICDRYAEIVAIGTIADVMPIIDENRCITSIGLKKLENTSYPGLYALMQQSGVIKNDKNCKKIISSTVGYIIAPRLNAAGRISSASRAVELLLSDNQDAADFIAMELCEINKLRQKTEQEIYEQAIAEISTLQSDNKFLVLSSHGWHQGVIGVVASKIAEKYSLPCILFSVSDGIGKGSGRSVKGFSLMDALSACSDLLIEYGGHELAAGLSIEEKNIEEFRRRINEYTEEFLPQTESVLTIDVDCEVDFDEINLQSIEEIQWLEPFGLQNPVPIFVMRNVVISDINSLSGGKHVRLKLRPLFTGTKNQELNGVYFGMSQNNLRFYIDDVCDIAFSVDVNEYMGIQTPQLLIRAVKHSEAESEKREYGDILYEKICDESNHDKLPVSIFPTLTDFRAVFRFLKKEMNTKQRKMSVVSVCKQVCIKEKLELNTCKIRIIFDVLSQESIVKMNYIGKGDIFEMEFLPIVKKVNLDDSKILGTIKRKHYLYTEEEKYEI
ncbi:MAG: single-stranded-DNA-specific exonuclease RecJ [Clostridiales bacterium GWF2_36_10]|nr:MAG: single-stranded-DNA-specific exonuclease RecJ [Clostridiales bacterium GWF2_36_10]HAN21127.1 single-stranded-DNA-specific exonuclease RecJ [Clostridiales bacterium]